MTPTESAKRLLLANFGHRIGMWPQEASARPPSVSLRVPPCSLAADMDDLLKTGRLADAVLVAADDGYECRVHKAILGARSPVFAAMFEHDMAESKSNRVVVGDVSGDVLLQVLRCVSEAWL